MKITVAIPTYKRPKTLAEALQSIVVQKCKYDCQIYILDNACDVFLQEQIEDIAQHSPRKISYIPVPEIGLHNGRNRAALESQNDIIVYIDDDVLAPPDWLQNLCEPFENPEVMGVGGKVLPKWEALPPDWISKVHPSYFSLLDCGEDIQEMKLPQTPYGCNMAYRRQIILDLNGFPPDGVGGGNIEWKRGDGETGFAHNLYTKGYKIIYTPKGWLYHRIPKSRMTIDYIKNRTMKSAISSCYSQIRVHQYNKIQVFKKSVITFLKFSIYQAISVAFFFLPNTKKTNIIIKTNYFKFSCLYCVRFLVDPELRDWVKLPKYNV